jgi:foldase protein PrsA
MRSAVQAAYIPVILAATIIIASCVRHAPVAEPAAPMRFIEATDEDKKIIIAKVNGAEITNYALIDMANRLTAIDQRSSLSESKDAIRKRALDILVLEELALQEAARQGLRVDDTRIDKTMEQFIKKMGHEEGYNKYLAENHITSVEFRAQVERSLLIQLMLIKEVLNKASVSDDEMQKEYELRRGEYLSPEKVTVVDVVVPLQQGRQAAMKRAQELLAAINADKDKDPAHLVSDATFSFRVVDLDQGKEPALYESARKLKTGELSGAIAGNDAVHILKLTDYSPRRELSYEEAKEAINNKLMPAAQLKRRLEWEQELKKGATIEVLNAPAQLEHKKP